MIKKQSPYKVDKNDEKNNETEGNESSDSEFGCRRKRKKKPKSIITKKGYENGKNSAGKTNKKDNESLNKKTLGKLS